MHNTTVNVLPLSYSTSDVTGMSVASASKCVSLLAGSESFQNLSGLSRALAWSSGDYHHLAQASLCLDLLNSKKNTSQDAEGSTGLQLLHKASLYEDGSFTLDVSQSAAREDAIELVKKRIVSRVTDPANHLLPQVNCDFSFVQINPTNQTQIRVWGAQGRSPDQRGKKCYMVVDYPDLGRGTQRVCLRDLAIVCSSPIAAGVSLGVISKKSAYLPYLHAQLSAQLVDDSVGGEVCGDVERFEMPGLGAFNFVLGNASGSGKAALEAPATAEPYLTERLSQIEIEVPTRLAESLS